MRYKAGDIIKNKDSGQVGEVTYTYNDRVFYKVEGGFMMSSDREELTLLDRDDDKVNHPSYYAEGNIEVVDFIEDKSLNFNLGNVVKYVSRAGKKSPDTYLQDLKKARWYLDREIQNFESR